jgi:predicted O-methyltransferase YrrM
MTTVPSVGDVRSVVGDLPFMTLERAEAMTRLIHENGVRDVLELGFCHGVSTCYMAAALEQRGEGHVVTIDRASRILNAPSGEGMSEPTLIRHRATIFYEYDSYNWRMQHFLAQSVRPEFDLVYLDGAHTWNVDGFAFLLAERLLAPGGVIVLDDLSWSFATSQSTCTKTSAMPKDERELEQVRLIFDLLVKHHPNIAEVWEDGNWGFARKRAECVPDLGVRDEALTLIEQQAREVRECAERRVPTGEWEYPAWPGSLLPILDTSDRRKLEDLRHLVEKLKRDRAWLQAKLGNDG